MTTYVMSALMPASMSSLGPWLLLRSWQSWLKGAHGHRTDLVWSVLKSLPGTFGLISACFFPVGVRLHSSCFNFMATMAFFFFFFFFFGPYE